MRGPWLGGGSGGGVGVAVADVSQGSGRPDGWQLGGVADQDKLRARPLDADGQAEQVNISGHAGLVEDHRGPCVKRDVVVVEPPEERGDGARLDVGFNAEGARCLSAGRGAEHLMTGDGERVGGGVERGGLPGSGNTDDHLDSPA